LPPAGNFITIKIAQGAVQLYHRLLQEGIIVRPLANYGMPDYLRVSIGTPTQNERFIRTLQALL
jgi:histidinol-phosphate aminotransferase